MRLIEKIVNIKIRYLMILCLVCMIVVGLSKSVWSEPPVENTKPWWLCRKEAYKAWIWCVFMGHNQEYLVY
jgi:hypothetical protein